MFWWQVVVDHCCLTVAGLTVVNTDKWLFQHGCQHAAQADAEVTHSMQLIRPTALLLAHVGSAKTGLTPVCT